jgi:hypothetical protein
MTPEATSPPTIGAKPGRYLTFTLGRESYGLPVLGVREIIRLCPITPVPRMPGHQGRHQSPGQSHRFSTSAVPDFSRELR